MKKAILIFVTLLILAPFSAFGYTVFVGVDNSLQLSHVNGIQFDISGAGFNWADTGTTSAQLYLTSATAVVNGVSKPGAVPNAFWVFDKVTSPAIGFSTFDGLGGGNILSAGIVASITAPNTFSLLNWVLADYSQPNGKYASPFFVSQTLFSGGSEYTISAVPIPAAVWLLGTGVVGLVILRRRRS